MSYIYDILLNFQNEYYDFYEWNDNDKIIHIKKTPIIKVSDKDFLKIKYSDIVFNENFLNLIHHKTQVFKKYDINTFNNICIICSDKEAIGLKINKNGKVIGKSSLLIEENDEVLELTYNSPCQNVEYTADNFHKEILQTRYEITERKNIINKLNNLFENKEFDKLKFLFFECFNYKEENINIAFNKLKKEVLEFKENYYKIDEFLKLTNT